MMPPRRSESLAQSRGKRRRSIYVEIQALTGALPALQPDACATCCYARNRDACEQATYYSHSMVAGGFEVMS